MLLAEHAGPRRRVPIVVNRGKLAKRRPAGGERYLPSLVPYRDSGGNRMTVPILTRIASRDTREDDTIDNFQYANSDYTFLLQTCSVPPSCLRVGG